jgi:outer membrane protein TolC
MRAMKRSSLALFILFLVSFSTAQEIVTEKDYLLMLLQEHPIARQADLLENQGLAKLLKAKGWFDPKLDASYDQKSFDGKNYFQVVNGGLRVPTWIGADIKLNYDWNNGIFINSENNLPTSGLITAGIELPLLRGLIMDKRRADLQQGKNYVFMGELERQQLLNNLIFDARKAYWEWYEAYMKLLINREGVLLAEITFDFVKSSSRLGDKPAIDTLEALVQVQNRKIEEADAQLLFLNNTLLASSFLWLEGYVPARFSENAIPQEFILMDVPAILASVEGKEDELALANPMVELFKFKRNNLEIETRLKREMLKPQLNLAYNFIARPVQETGFDQFNVANYKWNVHFSMPLFLRKERGDLAIVKAELEGANLEYSLVQLKQRNKIESISNKIRIFQEQLRLSGKNVIDNSNLVKAEKRIFEIGESSLFLVNFREIMMLKVMQKQAEIESKLQISVAELDNAIGR